MLGLNFNVNADQARIPTDNSQKETKDRLERDIELNTLLMHSTFMLAGQSKEENKIPEVLEFYFFSNLFTLWFTFNRLKLSFSHNSIFEIILFHVFQFIINN